MKRLWILLSAITLLKPVFGEYCHHGESCYPTNQQLSAFNSSLQGHVFMKGDPDYEKLVIMKNTRVTKYPDVIVAVLSTDDVQKSVLFARQYNLKIVIQSSGHDFQGRSTADDSFMIYLGKMNNIDVKTGKTDRNLAGEIILESGTQWVDVYRTIDSYDRVVVGGSAHTVAIGGWTLGGGHSPISGMVGLGVDSLLEVLMVTADGRIVKADNSSTHITYPNETTETSSDSDIFWALSGGGGGTYGIVTHFTFKMHFPPSAMVKFVCDYPVKHKNGTFVGANILRAYADLVVNMPAEWGGYILMSSTAKWITDLIYKDGSAGSITLFMNHFGGFDTPSRAYMDAMFNYQGMARHCSYENVTSFWEYEQNVTDTLYYRNVLIGTLMQEDSFTDEWVNFMIDFVMRAYYNEWVATTSVTGIHLGGKVLEVSTNATSVHPAWRSSYMSIAMGFGWGNDDGSKHDQDVLNLVNGLQNQLYSFGDGMYPNEAGNSVPSFQTRFWGSNYPRLLEIKNEWDPDHVFSCLECISYRPVSGATRVSNCFFVLVINLVLPLFVMSDVLLLT